MATDSPISPHRCTLLELTPEGGKSVISGKWFQAMTYLSWGTRAQTLLFVINVLPSKQWQVLHREICMHKSSMLHLIGKWTMQIWLEPKVIQWLIISLRRSSIFPSALIYSFSPNDFRFSWENSVFFSFEKESSFDVRKMGFAKAFCTVDRSCAKLFFCTVILTFFVPIWCLWSKRIL